MTQGNQFDDFNLRGNEWLDNASPAELWDVMHHGGLDAKVGLSGLHGGLGILEGPSAYGESLATREWAAGASGDFQQWFLQDLDAQEAAKNEIRFELTELAYGLGATAEIRAGGQDTSV